MSSLKLYVIRHGYSESNKGKYYSGWGDVSLAEEGFEDARRAGELLRGIRFDRVYTSDLRRAQQTCETALPGVAYIPDYRLNEIGVGVLYGLHQPEALERYGDRLRWTNAHRDYDTFGGESCEDQYARVASFLREMEHIGEGTFAAFCHEGTIQSVFNYVIGGRVNVFPARVDNGSVSMIEWDGKMWHVNVWNRLPGPLAGAYTKPDD